MKIASFDPPALVDDLNSIPSLKQRWSVTMSGNVDRSIQDVQQHLTAQGGGTCQFYNPVTQGRTDPDLPLSAGDVTWNGFPRRFLNAGPHGGADFAGAEPSTFSPGQERPQDEYLEWHVTRNGAGKITSVEFTCEGYDYYTFLGAEAPDVLVGLYQKFVNPAVKKADLFQNGIYDRLNHWNLADGAMHLTNGANNLFAEVFLAASATVRRKKSGAEVTDAQTLITCSKFGDAARNSDPAIGAAVNSLARDGRMITLANPIGLYIAGFNGAGFLLPDGPSAAGFFQIVRGTPGRALRVVFRAPAALAATGLTVSDVSIGGVPITFGGQIAQHITMKLTAAASQAQPVQNPPIPCVAAGAHALAALPLPHRGALA